MQVAEGCSLSTRVYGGFIGVLLTDGAARLRQFLGHVTSIMLMLLMYCVCRGLRGYLYYLCVGKEVILFMVCEYNNTSPFRAG